MPSLARHGLLTVLVTALVAAALPATATQPEQPKPVEVVNVPGVMVVDNAHRAFSRRGECQIADGEPICIDPIDLPAGTRLVIEAFSAQAVVPAGQRVFVQIKTSRKTENGSEYVRFTLPMASQGQNLSGRDVYAGFESGRLYSDSALSQAAEMDFTISRSDTTGTASLSWGLSGYLVDCAPSGEDCPVQ